ncbi:hypothetical protein LOTGIDRAFT_140156 [Lottia gigantea]|uniref:Chitin-binding type-2 domain-containing protein n=1 Tax=Lottia gigantea TaxID=225164 RepID=V4AAJ1_LOTGI|nr:hypothetical protein LOTGIDRAFT_140156 [Lottia gigantea]ESP00989.1 hypothetical protein LOTGIDRAFT_140156 [Lottia gigantea]
MKCPPPTSGFFPDKNNCAYFLQCTSNKRYRTRCPGGTLFDEHIKRCNHKEFVTCWSKIKCPHPMGLFSHPHDCGKYLNCFANIPYVQSCPAGLHFNMAMGYCDFPSNAMCATGGNKGHGNKGHGKTHKKLLFDLKTLFGI